MKSILRHWLPIAVVIVAMSGLVYLAVQQELRHYANDPQIQMAEDAADTLALGGTVESVLPAGKVDIARGLAPFMLVFNDAGETVVSSGLLHGQVPALPVGVLDYARQHGENRVTWQPEPGVRIAAVVVRYSGTQAGFVLVGRSLREIEKREDQAELEAGVAGIVTLVASLVVVAFGEILLADDKK